MYTTTKREQVSPPPSDSDKSTMSDRNEGPQDVEVNETGHIQELERNFSLLSACSVGIVTGNTWAALGGSITVAVFNGGPPGVLFEFIAVSIFYWLIAASLAELASSMPSSAGVYHWASLTPGPKYGPLCGWFAGWWNTFAWICATATMSSISSQILTAMYSIYHPRYIPQRWHTFVCYLIITWICCSTVMFANRSLPRINKMGLIFILIGVIITTIFCAVSPGFTGSGYASSSFVWANWVNATGYTSDTFVFLLGMLNGAYAIGTPDCVSHLAEEIPRPKRNLPLAIAAQMAFGFVSTFFYAVAILYAINDLDDVRIGAWLFPSVLTSPVFPLARIYAQASSSQAGTVGLLLLIFVPIFCGCIGSYITASRCLWTMARDEAVPFHGFLGTISPRFKNQFNAALTCGIFATLLGLMGVVSTTAFNAFIGSFVVLSSLSYIAAIAPFIFTRRFSGASQGPGSYANTLRPGPYQMGNLVGNVVNIVSCLYISIFVVIFCFPASLPVTAASMNYSGLIAGSLTVWSGVYYLVKKTSYIGPRALIRRNEVYAPPNVVD